MRPASLLVARGVMTTITFGTFNVESHSMLLLVLSLAAMGLPGCCSSNCDCLPDQECIVGWCRTASGSRNACPVGSRCKDAAGCESGLCGNGWCIAPPPPCSGTAVGGFYRAPSAPEQSECALLAGRPCHYGPLAQNGACPCVMDVQEHSPPGGCYARCMKSLSSTEVVCEPIKTRD